MKTSIAIALLALLTAVSNAEIQPIKTPLLPVLLGQATVTNNYHSFIFAINLTSFKEQANSLHKAIFNMHFEEALNFSSSLLPTSDINTNHMQIALTQISRIQTIIEDRLDQITPARTKRGLVNLIGKADKFLFGTLDADDEKYFTDQINTLQDNQYKLSIDLYNQKSILLNITETYNKKIRTLVANQQLLLKHIEDIREKYSNIQHLYSSLQVQQTLDLIKNEYATILEFIDQLHTCISLARLNIFHPSIIKTSELDEILNIMNKLYKNHTITFSNSHSYYELLETSVKISKNMIFFYIHFPLIWKSNLNIYHLYPIPLNNQTPILHSPYYLSTRSSPIGEAPNPGANIEKYYFIHRKTLHAPQKCIQHLIEENRFTCDVAKTFIEENIVLQLQEDANKLIVIPKNRTSVVVQCEQFKQTWIQAPVLVTLNTQCSVVIGNVTYKSSSEIVQHTINAIEPIIIDSQQKALEETPLSLNAMHLEDLEFMRNQIKDLKLHALKKTVENNLWTDLGSTIIIIIILISAFVAFIYIKYFRKPAQPNTNTTLPNQSNVQSDCSNAQQNVLFSHLGREE